MSICIVILLGTPFSLFSKVKVSETLTCNTLEYDFGDLEQGGCFVCEFVIANTSKVKVDITNIVSGCSCLKLLPSSCGIPPNSSITIKATYDSSERKLGGIRQVFCVYFSSMLNPIVFAVKANIVQGQL